MRLRVRHHVNPLRLRFVTPRAGGRLALPDGREVEVELGCADARFLFERARAAPGRHHVGLEIREELVARVDAQARAEGLPNLEVRFANVTVDLDDLLPDGRVRRFFVLFPDPWFKRRHQKRRLVTPELVALLRRKLEPDGEIAFASDVFDLALDALAAFEEADAHVTNAHGPWSFERERRFEARSRREVECTERGLPIWRMRYRAR